MATMMETPFIAQATAAGPVTGNAGGRAFGKSLLSALDHGTRHVVVDCRDWRQLDIVLLSSLVRCADVFNSRGATLELINLSPEMRANIRELRLMNRLHVVD